MAKPDPTVQVVCLLRFDDDHRLTAAQAKIIEMAIKEALHCVLPRHRHIGLWVHRAADFEWRPAIRPVRLPTTRGLNRARATAISAAVRTRPFIGSVERIMEMMRSL